ncbi:hypothetical protein E7742_00770 [Rhodococcus sp. SGAir0479]|nr:hypothetical protein E7742_00770 [Rhodococcus sp. SGAir0479]
MVGRPHARGRGGPGRCGAGAHGLGGPRGGHRSGDGRRRGPGSVDDLNEPPSALARTVTRISAG